MLELKLDGNHLDRPAVERALLRRQARQVQRLEDHDAKWRGEEPLWLVAPHVPDWMDKDRAPEYFAPGCYWVEKQWGRFLWIAANELPLVEELTPFLLARSGGALEEFIWWAASRRPYEWVADMVKSLAMPELTKQELMKRFGKSSDPEVEARRQELLNVMLRESPEVQEKLRQEGRQEGQLILARESVRHVLARRRFTLSQDDEARIDACSDLPTLKRWLDQSVTAASVSDALA
jgi:hypothetical protein